MGGGLAANGGRTATPGPQSSRWSSAGWGSVPAAVAASADLRHAPPMSPASRPQPAQTDSGRQTAKQHGGSYYNSSRYRPMERQNSYVEFTAFYRAIFNNLRIAKRRKLSETASGEQPRSALTTPVYSVNDFTSTVVVLSFAGPGKH